MSLRNLINFRANFFPFSCKDFSKRNSLYSLETSKVTKEKKYFALKVVKQYNNHTLKISKKVVK